MTTLQEQALRESLRDSLISFLQKDEFSVLYINTDAKEIGKKDKVITLNDRIPSKKFDLITALHTDEKDNEKLAKYKNKFNYAYIISLPSEADRGISLELLDAFTQLPTVTFSLRDSSILANYSSFLTLTEKYPEFTQSSVELFTDIQNNLFTYAVGAIDSIHPDILIAFQSETDKQAFLQRIQEMKDEEAIHAFYNQMLLTYAKGIDTRNARFKKNMQFMLQTGNTASKNIGSGISHTFAITKQGINKAGKSITKGTTIATVNVQKIVKKIQDRPKKAKPVIEKKQKVIKAQKELKVTKVIKKQVTNIQHSVFDKAIFTIRKLGITLYLNRNIPQIKQLTYEEYLAKEHQNLMPDIREKRQLQQFKLSPKISIIMIVHDIDEIWINKSVRSIKDQTYKNWELILVDNCSPRTYLKSYLSSLNDPRIKTHFYNTKKTYAECIAFATKLSKGEYLSFLEEGDEIEVKSLFYFVKEINKNPNLDLIYSNEDEINEQGKKIAPFIKPGWDSTLILSYPYTNHLLCVKKELVERVDALKSHNIKDPLWDLMLRIRNATSGIIHTPYILYHKRIRPLQKKEPSSSPEALQTYMSRETIQGDIKKSSFPGSFYILRKDLSSTKVSIILLDHTLENIHGFIDNTHITHKNFEYIVGSNQIPNETRQKQYTFKYMTDLSFSHAANTLAANIDTDYLLFVYTRLRATTPDFVNILMSEANPQTIVGTKIIDPDEVVQNSIYAHNVRNIFSTLYEGAIDKNQFDINVTRECTAVSKKCMLISKSLFSTMPFNESLEYSYQDIDVCMEATKMGNKVIFSPDAKMQTTYAYNKEHFNEKDSLFMLKKWGKTLEQKDAYIDTARFLSLKH